MIGPNISSSSCIGILVYKRSIWPNAVNLNTIAKIPATTEYGIGSFGTESLEQDESNMYLDPSLGNLSSNTHTIVSLYLAWHLPCIGLENRLHHFRHHQPCWPLKKLTKQYHLPKCKCSIAWIYSRMQNKSSKLFHS